MNKLIMVVDDEISILTMLEIMLRRHGFRVIKARDAYKAIELLDTETPDLFILDVMMPGMSGLELCSYLRSVPQLTTTPIVILSALSDSRNIEVALKAGANAFLSKTTVYRELVSSIHHLLNAEVQEH